MGNGAGRRNGAAAGPLRDGMKRPHAGLLRSVTDRARFTGKYHPHGTYSVVLSLECGHQKRYKGSEEPRGARVRCLECKR